MAPSATLHLMWQQLEGWYIKLALAIERVQAAAFVRIGSSWPTSKADTVHAAAATAASMQQKSQRLPRCLRSVQQSLALAVLPTALALLSLSTTVTESVGSSHADCNPLVVLCLLVDRCGSPTAPLHSAPTAVPPSHSFVADTTAEAADTWSAIPALFLALPCHSKVAPLAYASAIAASTHSCSQAKQLTHLSSSIVPLVVLSA